MVTRSQISRATYDAYRGAISVQEYLDAMQETITSDPQKLQYFLNSLKTKEYDLEILRDLKPEDAEKENLKGKEGNLVAMVNGAVVSFTLLRV